MLADVDILNDACKKFDMSYSIENQYKHSDYFLNELIIEVERNLIKKQNEDLPNQQMIQRFEKTLNRLLLIQEYINKSQGYIKQLEAENEQLKHKFEHYKINIK